MKKKQPTLTHYTKRLKKVRLARTITVIATLFVSGVVVAANVLPQVIKSNASTTADTSNDVIAGGVDQYNGANAKSQLIAKVFTANDAQAQSARALYTKFGVSQADIQGSTFKWLYGPNATKSVTPNESIVPYGGWNSFGRNNGSGFTLLQVAYGTSTANFYYKPFSVMHPNTWGNGTSAEPVLMGNGWFIALECGNIVVKTIPTNPTINFVKSAVSVKRGTKTFTEAEVNAAGFKLLVNDQIKYRLTGKNGSVAYPAGLRLADAIPENTSFVAQGGDGWAGGVVLTNVNPKPVVDGKTYVAWDFSAIPANASGFTDFTVKVDKVVSQICNVGLWASKPGVLPAQTNQVCLAVQPNAPKLTISKVAQNAPTSLKIGDNVTYKIVMKNEGTATAANAVALDILKKDAANAAVSQQFVSLGTPALTRTADGVAIPVASTDWTKVDTAAKQKTYANGNADAYGIWLKNMPAGSTLTFSITTKALKFPESCDFAITNFTGSGNPIAAAKTPNVCIPVIDINKPHITVIKTSPTANRNVSRGQTINYSIVVANTSPQKAQTSEVTVTDTFTPAGNFKDIKETSRSASFNASITSTKQANGLTWKIASIPANGKVTFNISATVVDTAADATKICNNATITMTPPNTVISETSSTVCNTVSLIKLQKTAKYVNRDEDPQKSPANAGDVIEYTLTTTNQAATVAKAYVVTEDLSDVLSYADVTNTGGGELNGTKLIWAARDIPANNGSIVNKFQVTVKNPIPNNEPSTTNPSSFDYNMFNNYGNDVNIKINKPLIQQIVDVATDLPQTGAAQYGLVIFFLGLSVYFFVRNKQLTGELAAATVEYQHQASAGTMTQAQNLIHPEDDTVTPEPPAAPPVA